jgi:hypothetical protein
MLSAFTRALPFVVFMSLYQTAQAVKRCGTAADFRTTEIVEQQRYGITPMPTIVVIGDLDSYNDSRLTSMRSD